MTATSAETTTWRDLLRNPVFWRYLPLCLGVWLHAADMLLAATTVPSAVEEIGGRAYIGWTVALYQLGSIIAAALVPSLTGRFGLRSMLAVAAASYGIGCFASGIGPTMAWMLAGRAAQGVGGGALLALSYAAIERMFPERFWTRVMAVVSTIWGASSLVGPLIGGWFAGQGAWRYAFYAFAIQAALLVILVICLPRGVGGQARRIGFDPRPLALLSAAVFAIAAAGLEARVGDAALLGIVGLVLLGGFAWRDAQSLSPLLPRRLLDVTHPIGNAFLAIFLLSIATMSFVTYAPVLMDRLTGTSPLVAGYVVAFESVCWTLAALLVAGSRSERKPIVIGTGMVLAGVLLLVPTLPLGDALWLLIPAVLQGGGFGMAWAFIAQRTMKAAEDDERSQVAGTMPTVQMIGYAIGAAAAGIAANQAGFAQHADAETARAAAFAVAVWCVPFAAAGFVFAVRLARR